MSPVGFPQRVKKKDGLSLANVPMDTGLPKSWSVVKSGARSVVRMARWLITGVLPGG